MRGPSDRSMKHGPGPASPDPLGRARGDGARESDTAAPTWVIPGARLMTEDSSRASSGFSANRSRQNRAIPPPSERPEKDSSSAVRSVHGSAWQVGPLRLRSLA
jgi:hypothetical protein